MAEIGNLVPLKQVVANVLWDLGIEADSGNTLRYTQWGIRGMRKVSTFFGAWVKTAKLEMTAMDTVTLPEDYVAFIRIGVPYKGRLWVSTRDSNLLIPTDVECGEEVINEEDGEDLVLGAVTTSHFMNPGGQNKEYYRIDLEGNRIIMNGVSRTTVILEYKSNGINFNGKTRIPRIAEESVIAWIHRERTRFDRTSTAKDAAMADQRWVEEVRYLKRAQEPGLDALYDAVMAGWKYGPKR